MDEPKGNESGDAKAKLDAGNTGGRPETQALVGVVSPIGDGRVRVNINGADVAGTPDEVYYRLLAAREALEAALKFLEANGAVPPNAEPPADVKSPASGFVPLTGDEVGARIREKAQERSNKSRPAQPKNSSKRKID